MDDVISLGRFWESLQQRMKQISPKAPNRPAGIQIITDVSQSVGGMRWPPIVITGFCAIYCMKHNDGIYFIGLFDTAEYTLIKQNL